jgi:hypothetical protein
VKNELALRYLLLRHLERLEDRVPAKRYSEVTSSLQVESNGRTSYLVRYQDLGQRCERSFAFDTFSFYERGDTRPDRRSANDDLSNRNDEHAAEFARRVFGVDAAPESARRLPRLEAVPAAAIIEMAAFPLAVGFAGGLGGGLGVVATAALALVCLAELAPRGRSIASALFCGVALTGPALATLFGAPAYALLQGLDPNPEQRRSRVMLCLLAAVLALGGAPGGVAFELGLISISIAVGATGLAAFRSLHTSHFRALPLALPFYCAGLALGGQTRAALCGLVVLGLGTIFGAAGHHVIPVQRSRG